MKLENIQSAIRDEGLDGWLFFDHHRRDPLAYRILELPAELQPTRRWYYFIPALGEPRGLVHRIETHGLDTVPGRKLVYSRWTEQATQLRQLIGSAKRVAMQYSAQCGIPYVSLVDAGTVELIRALDVEVMSSADLVQLFEARWNEAQFKSHMQAGQLMDGLRADAFHFVRTRLQDDVSVSEWDVRAHLLDQFATKNLVTDHGPIVAVNANASDPHYEPDAARHRLIERGDLLLIDMWAKLDQPSSVYYDITWTAYCGAVPPDEMQNVFAVVAGGRDAGISTVQNASGTLRGCDIDDAVRGYIESRNLGRFFIHRTGHSIGADVHGTGANMDNFETHDARRIIPYTCFSIEPGVYLPNFGIRSEVDVFIGESGAMVTGEIQRELLRLA